MRVKIIDRVFLVVFSVEDPTDEEWDGLLRLVEAQGVERTAKLVLTDGGAPSLKQVKRLRILLDGRDVPVAVVSPSVRVRASVFVLSWFDRRLRAFPPAGLKKRTVVRLPRHDVVRLDNLRARLPVPPGERPALARSGRARFRGVGPRRSRRANAPEVSVNHALDAGGFAP